MTIRERLNNLARQFYEQLGYQARANFDFSSSQHPTERAVYRMAEIAWEEFIGDRPDYAEDDDDDEPEALNYIQLILPLGLRYVFSSISIPLKP